METSWRLFDGWRGYLQALKAVSLLALIHGFSELTKHESLATRPTSHLAVEASVLVVHF